MATERLSSRGPGHNKRLHRVGPVRRPLGASPAELAAALRKRRFVKEVRFAPQLRRTSLHGRQAGLFLILSGCEKHLVVAAKAP